MKKNILIAAWFCAGTLWAQGTDPTAAPQASPSPSPTPVLLEKWAIAAVPWDAWFKNNAMVTDKGEYVHFFWNAQDFKGNFEVKDRKLRLSEAALQLVSRLYPADAKAELAKVDIVYVLERDAYGQPKWDSLVQAAHFEFLKSKALKALKGKKEPNPAVLQKSFDQAVFY